MTNRQYEIYRCVLTYKKLGLILEHTGIKDSFALQCAVGNNVLDFHDDFLDDNTVVTLTASATEAYENRQRFNWKEFRDWAALVLALYGSITATIALLK